MNNEVQHGVLRFCRGLALNGMKSWELGLWKRGRSRRYNEPNWLVANHVH